MNRQRMDTVRKIVRQNGIDHTMALQPALAVKRFRHDINAEVSLAAWTMPTVAGMLVGLVLDVQTLRRKGFP